MAIGEGSIFLLNVAAVGQQNAAQITGTRGGIHMARKPFLRQQGQVAAVIQMGVRQQHSIDLIRRNGQRGPIAKTELLVTLKQATVDQQAFLSVADQVFGASDSASAAKKGDVDAHVEQSHVTSSSAATFHKKSRKGIEVFRGLSNVSHCFTGFDFRQLKKLLSRFVQLSPLGECLLPPFRRDSSVSYTHLTLPTSDLV